MSSCSHACTSGNGSNNYLDNLDDKLFPINFHDHAI